MNIVQKQSIIYIKNNGLIDPFLRTRAFGGYNHASISITGRPMSRTWSLLSSTSSSGSTSIQLMHNPIQMGWRLGDRISIAPTTSSSTGTSQNFFIKAFAPNNVIFLGNYSSPRVYGNTSMMTNSSTNQMYKSTSMYVSEAWTAHMSAEVMNLQRTILITGDDYENVPCQNGVSNSLGCQCDPSISKSTCTVGLHTAMMINGTLRMEYVRVEKCGQRGILGKYCIHLHQLGSCVKCSILGNAVENSQHRGIVVHETHLATVAMNVISDVRGSHIYIEDGNEMYNRISYNVAVCPWPLSINGQPTALGGCSIPGTDNSQADTDLNQSGFWAAGFVNYLIGNRAANSFNGMLWQEQGVTAGRGTSTNHECINRFSIGRIEGNTFHGHGRFGTYLLADVYPRQTDQSLAANGWVTDKSTCNAWTSDGNERGLPQVILYQTDYDNVFVGQYSAGDVQYRHHTSINNDNLIYWKETKNFYDGCSAHISQSYYQGDSASILALPSGHGTFLIENTRFTSQLWFESNHHCNVGITGALLCMPQYVFVNITWESAKGQYFYFNDNTNNGALFTLGPDDCAASQRGLNTQIFPPYFCSLAHPYWTYLLSIDNGTTCFTSTRAASVVGGDSTATQFSNRYDNGILCKRPLRRLEVYTHSLTRAHNSTLNLILELYQNNKKISQQSVPYFQIGDDISNTQKQGFSMTVIPGSTHTYVLSMETSPGSGIGGRNIPLDWTIEFSDTIFGNRFPVDSLYIKVAGRNCPTPVTSLHDRRFIWADSDSYLTMMGRGACSPYPDMPKIDCGTVPPIEPFGVCEKQCSQSCNNGFCDCGSSTCMCNPGFFGPNCEIDLCEQAQCGPHGRCSALYLGGGLPVTQGQCVCDDGYFGPHCDANPCANVTCSGNGTCQVVSGTEYVCNCHPGYNGDNCESPCTGAYPVGTCQPPCMGGVRLYNNYNLNAGDIGSVVTTTPEDCAFLCSHTNGCACITYNPSSSMCYMKNAMSATRSSFAISQGNIAGIPCIPPPSVPLIPVLPSIPPPPVSTAVMSLPYLPCSQGCQQIYNVEFHGVDASVLVKMYSASECCSACRNTARCAGYTYNSATFTCSLKQQIVNSTTYSTSSTMISGLPCGNSCSLSECSILSNTNLIGGDLISVPGSQASDCCGSCSNTPYCMGWSFYQGMCLLKQWNNLQVTPVSQMYVTSGLISCVAPVFKCDNASTSSCSIPNCGSGGAILTVKMDPSSGICCDEYECGVEPGTSSSPTGDGTTAQQGGPGSETGAAEILPTASPTTSISGTGNNSTSSDATFVTAASNEKPTKAIAAGVSVSVGVLVIVVLAIVIYKKRKSASSTHDHMAVETEIFSPRYELKSP